MDKNNKHKKAFTFSEVILVLILIGVIAAIIIAVVNPSDQNQEARITLAKKTQQNIVDALTQTLLNDSLADNIVQLKDSGGAFLITDNNVTTRFVGIIKKYIQDTGALVDQVAQENYYGAKISHYNGTLADKKINELFGNFFFTTNGVLFGFRLNGNCTTTETLEYLPERRTATSVDNTCGSIYIDVNGYKKPNKLGSDQYIFPFDSRTLKYTN